MQSYDVTIVGAGMVGLTLALALKYSDLRVAVIDDSEIASPLGALPQLRVSAINLASQNILKHLGAWNRVQDQRLQAYDNMLVWEKDSFAKISFSAQQAASTQLGFIVENQAIRLALLEQIEQCGNISLITPCKIERMDSGQSETFVTLSNGSALTTKLVVGADGANSFVRKRANMPLTFWDYDHHAIVATIGTQLPHNNTARQVFTRFGPLALLPLYEQNLCSIVWSTEVTESQRLMAMSEEQFNRALTATSDNVLGLTRLQSERQSYPLKMRYCREWVQDRIALVGDAAHTIHPLAGQGANLGMCDAAALAELLLTLHSEGKDIGLAKHLRPYERWRKTEATKMIATMEGFKRLFGGNNGLKKLVRDIGLTLTDKATPLKQSLIRHAIGLQGELPEMAKSTSLRAVRK